MIPGGIVPDWLLSITAACTLFVVMFDLGLAVVPGEFRAVLRPPGLLTRALFAVLVAVPCMVWLVCRVFDLSRPVEIGMMLMAIAPGAPFALRNSLGAGGHPAFAPVLQIGLAFAAIVSMPLWILGLDEYYAGTASVDPRHLARQVMVAQLLPLALGMLARWRFEGLVARLEPALRQVGSGLLGLLLVLALLDVYQTVLDAGPRVAVAIVVATLLALAAGHLLGGPAAGTRTATAISSASRNAGLALLVATLNHASAAIVATVLAYFVLSASTVVVYALWRRRTAAATAIPPPARGVQ